MQLTKEQYEEQYKDKFMLPYNEWILVENKSVRNHWLTPFGKFIYSKVISDIIPEDFKPTDTQIQLVTEFLQSDIHISDNTKRSIAYFLIAGVSTSFIDHFKQQKTLTRMSLEWLTHTFGNERGVEIYNQRIQTLNAATVSMGKASVESTRVFQQAIDFLKEKGIDYKFGEDGNRELVLYCEMTARRYCYDLCVPEHNIIFEYHGNAFHPNPKWDHQKWRSWKQAKTGISADEQYKMDVFKRRLAEANGYTVIELYADTQEDENSRLCLSKVKSVTLGQCFEKTVLFTDIHFGLRGNSKEHNETCLDFTRWMIDESIKRGVKTCMFLGDFFHNRSTVNVDTLNYGIQCVEMLSNAFDEVYMLVGNHDMYFRHKRNVHSIMWADSFSNVHLVDTIQQVGDCLFLPFLVGDEWKTIQQYEPKYIFGHLELPGYKLNSLIEMPDHGKENEDTFNKCEFVFSGHFHKRQRRTLSSGTQIHYIGNPFPHNFNDAWDDARGCVFLDHGTTPFYMNWDAGPRYRTANMSELLADPLAYLKENVTIKVNLDVDLTAEEIIFIRETFKSHFKLTDFKTIGSKKNDISIETEHEVHVESVDQVVLAQIQCIDSPTLDKALLMEIYQNL